MSRLSLGGEGSEGVELWLKNDGLSHPDYGGNKVRKLERLLAAAEQRGARRLLTLGPAGSHHVLATALFGAARGFAVRAVLFPQADTPHARATLAQSLASGLDPIRVDSPSAVPWALAKTLGRGDYLIGPGGSNPLGAESYADAVSELAAQLEGREPDLMVVALGSGGTAAGLLAGVVERQAATRILAVDTGALGRAAPACVLGLAARVLQRRGQRVRLRALLAQLEVDRTQAGPGYGQPTAQGLEASALAQGAGLILDPTYTAKAFAAALARVGRAGFSNPDLGRRAQPLRRVLYWHTLSAAEPPEMRTQTPALPPELGNLFVPAATPI